MKSRSGFTTKSRTKNETPTAKRMSIAGFEKSLRPVHVVARALNNGEAASTDGAQAAATKQELS